MAAFLVVFFSVFILFRGSRDSNLLLTWNLIWIVMMFEYLCSTSVNTTNIVEMIMDEPEVADVRKLYRYIL